ncbi:MAG: beta-ketoacyl synthase N-terminal-like domain-containing protein, partial [Gammaproteobacteria bacterium]
MSDKRRGPADRPAGEAAGGDRRDVLQSALAAIDGLQAKLAAAQGASREPIAIVGMGCRIPGGVTDAQGYWKVLEGGLDVVGEIPPDRWDVEAYFDPDPAKLGKSRTKAGGFLDDLSSFEPSFFGMSPREATGVDPQQRLLLEVVWEALENAAIPGDRLDGSQTGVFVGITSMDYSNRIDVSDPARSDIYLATGTALNAAAGRISFTLGLQGPCMAIDTACSSSLVAIHTACQSLRNRESDLALAGGVNAILSPDPFVLISKWGMLSPDGRCKSFDASANGFVRGEGCSMIVLERLSDAVANGRRILGVIRGSAINQDGRSSGLTAPNGLAQQAVVRSALRAANLKATDVSYVEAHGTGTSLGDPIEVEALAAVYGEGRPMSQPFEIGSVKSNIGHLEAASGVTGLIKILLSMQHRKLPASLHVKKPTPAIPWDSLPVKISTELHDWVAPGKRLIAGVSAFGFSGMNAHVIVEEPPAAAPANAQPARQLQILPLSARGEVALAALATRYADHLLAHPEQDLADVCATAATGRAQFVNRVAMVAADRSAMVAQLRAAAEGDTAVIRGQAAVGARVRIAFLFTGQGSQYAGMGRDLYETEPVFRDVLDRCAAVLDPLLERPLRDVMFSDPDGKLGETGYTQPALYALEVSLGALWRSWGIEPSFVIGHSVGEFAAAATTGVFSIEDGARLIAARGRLMQALPAGGGMIAIQGNAAAVEREIAKYSDRVSIAAMNAPGSIVISGAKGEIQQIADKFAAQGMRVQPLAVSHAFHSPLMAPMLAEFRKVAASIKHSAPSSTWISNLTGTALDWSQWGERMADYWERHVLQPVLFERGMRALGEAGVDICIETGPNPVLIGLGKLCLADAAPVEWLPSLTNRKPTWDQMLDSVARLHVRGARLNWSAITQASRHNVALPTYPFQRQHFLIDFRNGPRRAPTSFVHELLGTRLSVAGVAAQFERIVTRDDPAWLQDHRIGGEVLMPLTGYLEAAIAAARQVYGEKATGLLTIEVGEPMILREGESRQMQVVVEAARDGAPPRVRLFSRDAAQDDAAWTSHVSAEVRLGGSDDATALTESFEVAAIRCAEPVDVAPFYDHLRDLGVEFGPTFQGMRTVRRGTAEALGEIDIGPALAADAGKFQMHPAMLDACFHVSGVAVDALPGPNDGSLYLPVGLDCYRVGVAADGLVRCHARIRQPAKRGELIVHDIRVETLDGRMVASIEGLRCRRTSRNAFQQRSDAQIADWLYEVTWAEKAAPSVAERNAAGVWVIFDDGAGRAARLAESIEQRGGTAWCVVPGKSFASKGEGHIEVDPKRAQDIERVLELANESDALRGVVSFWPLRVPQLTAAQVPGELQEFGTESALLLVQAVSGIEYATPPRVWLITSGSQVADGTEAVRLEQAPVAGLARVAAIEHPELRVSLLDLDPQTSAGEARLLADELVGDSEETQVAFRKGTRRVARLARKSREPVTNTDDAPVRLGISTRGTLENLSIGPTERRAPGPGEIEIRVRASGLNFRDVLSALGMYPGEIRHLGSDCAGEVVTVGADVRGFKPGDRVVAMVEGAFASHATARWEFVAPL